MAETKEETVTETENKVQTNSYIHLDHKKKIIFLGSMTFLIFLIIACAGAVVVGKFARNRLVGNEQVGQGMNFATRGNREGMMSGRRGMMLGFNNNATQGKVTAVDGQKVTMDVSGTSKTVQIGTDTRFPLNSTTKIAVGDTISVVGEQDSTGTIQALRVIVNSTTIN